MFKLVIIPTLVVIETIRGTKSYTKKIKAALIALCIGVGFATVTDASLNIVGFFWGICSVLSTCQFQVWQGSRAKEFEMSPMQMVHSMAKYQFAMAVAMSIPMDWMSGGMHTIEMDMQGFFTIFTSCTFAVGSYFASFGLIGKTSPVTYQVIGHMKTISILTGGYLLFPVVMTAFQMFKNMIGVFIALLGAVLYGHLQMMAKDNVPDWIDRFAPESWKEMVKEEEYLPVDMKEYQEPTTTPAKNSKPASTSDLISMMDSELSKDDSKQSFVPGSPKFNPQADGQLKAGGSIL